MKLSIRIVSFLDFPLSVLLAHVVAAKVLNLYGTYPNMDILFHYMGGLSIAYSATKIIRYLEHQQVLFSNINGMAVVATSVASCSKIND